MSVKSVLKEVMFLIITLQLTRRQSRERLRVRNNNMNEMKLVAQINMMIKMSFNNSLSLTTLYAIRSCFTLKTCI